MGNSNPSGTGNRRIFHIFQVLLLTLSLVGCSSSLQNPPDIQTVLQAEGFQVQTGKVGLFDLVPMCCSPTPLVTSCYGNNANAPYLVAYLPNAPDQSPEVINTLYDPTTGLAPSFRLRADEAVALVGVTPPKSAYFSYTPYLLMRTLKNDQGESTRTRLYDSLTDSFNALRISTTGTPAGAPGNPYSKFFVIIYAADSSIANRVRKGFLLAGYPDTIININPLPSQLLTMELEQDSDELNIINRVALPDSQTKMDRYLEAPATVAYRITPVETAQESPFPVSTLISRSTGIPESSAVADIDLDASLEQLREKILASYPDTSYVRQELSTGLWLYDGRQCIDMGLDCLGDSRDTTYLRSPAGTGDITVGPPYFTLDNDEFIIVYGVNHAATGKTTYSSFSLYDTERMLGVKGVTSTTYADSSADYLADPRISHYLYAWKVARHCGDQAHCIEIPTGDCSTGTIGASLTSNLMIAFRNYQNPITGVGPALDEILIDRVIHFSPRN